MRRYFVHFTVAVLMLAGALAGFNWIVDPYAIYGNHSLMMQSSVPRLVMNERVFKTVALTHTPADIVLLGSSRTDIGIGAEHHAFAAKRVMNLATFGQQITETRRLMESVVAHSQPSTIIVGLDFFAFNGLLAAPTDYVDENYSPLRPYSLMLSVSTLTDSLTAVRRKHPATGDCCYADGFRTANDPAQFLGGYRRQFIANERAYLLEKYLPYPACVFSFEITPGFSSLQELRSMMRLAQQQQIDLRFFISPAHARQWETLAQAGLWSQWEEWKRQLVKINQETAMQFHRAEFPLWDFSGYDAYSTEAVPDATDRQRLMRWYSDSAHYTPALGQWVIQRMFSSQANVASWGMAINTENINAHLAQIQLARAQYRAAHPQDVAEIAATAQQVEQVKHCPSK